VKPYANSVEVHPQLSNNRHPVDGVLVGAGSLWLGKWYRPQEDESECAFNFGG